MTDKKIHLHLKRGDKGLGFNIIGGTDMPNPSGDCGIFVSKIKKGGAAYVDGTLRVGDRILEVNSISLENVKHQEAVQTFLSSGDDVRLVIERKISLDEVDSGGHKVKQVLKWTIPVVVVGAAVVVSILFVKRRNLF